MFSKISLSIFLILYIIKVISSQREINVPEKDLNKAVACLHVLSKKFDYEIDQQVYSSTILACFTAITDDDAKEILVAVQQDMAFLSPEEIDNLCNVNNLKKVEQKKLAEESKRLQHALKEFDRIREKKEENYGQKYDDNYNEKEEYKKAHPSQGNKLGKFMKETTNILKLINNFGKIIIIIIVLYFLYFMLKNCGRNDDYEHNYVDYAKLAKHVKKYKKKKN